MSTFVTSALLQESEMDSNKQPDSPTEEEPSTPRAVTTSQNPKYQLFLSKDLKTNGVSGKDADGPGGGGSVGENGPRLSRWETNRLGVNRGSLESLASRDLDAASDRVGDVEHGFCLCVVQIRATGGIFFILVTVLLHTKPVILQCHLLDRKQAQISLSKF